MLHYCYEPGRRVQAIVQPSIEHTMGDRLIPYLKLKLHHLLTESTPNSVEVIPAYDRNGVSNSEKSGKLFNFHRPSATLDDAGHIELRCFPGFDYILHFGSVVASYFANTHQPIPVFCVLPEVVDCQRALLNSGIPDLPDATVVILGYVEALDSLSSDTEWHGEGVIKWKRFARDVPGALLVGCQHTFWGEIAGVMVRLLAERGVEHVIYAGKLGSVDPCDIPNQCLATASTSQLPDGKLVRWRNIFEHAIKDECLVRYGDHITVPSVLSETRAWRDSLSPKTRFVDPEIGHMASAANKAGIGFSILHMISDNLARSYEHDLSNERVNAVLQNRKRLATQMTNLIRRAIRTNS